MPYNAPVQRIQLKRHQCIQVSIILALLMMATTGAKPAEIERDHAVPEMQIPGYIKEAVNSPDRPGADRQLDSSRKPEQLIAFLGIKPAMKVADLWAGGVIPPNFWHVPSVPTARSIRKIWSSPKV